MSSSIVSTLIQRHGLGSTDNLLPRRRAWRRGRVPARQRVQQLLLEVAALDAHAARRYIRECAHAAVGGVEAVLHHEAVGGEDAPRPHLMRCVTQKYSEW